MEDRDHHSSSMTITTEHFECVLRAFLFINDQSMYLSSLSVSLALRNVNSYIDRNVQEPHDRQTGSLEI